MGEDIRLASGSVSMTCWPAGVTLNRSLYETVLRSLLLESAEHSVELYEGSGCSWRKAK